MKKLFYKLIILFMIFSSIFIIPLLVNNDYGTKTKQIDKENIIISPSDIGFTSSTLISDGYYSFWNNFNDLNPSIAVNNKTGEIHVVWEGTVGGAYGTDQEILYSYSPNGIAWSIPIVISDGIGGIYWNDGQSNDPRIALDNSGNPHVVWYDTTQSASEWGTDWEIFYTNHTPGVGWLNATAISGMGINSWNDGYSVFPDIIIDSTDAIHVVWADLTAGIWRASSSDWEIFYMNYSSGIGWSNATIISDGYSGIYWNDGESTKPAIAIDKNEVLHIVWEDETDSVLWGTDREIWYTNMTKSGNLNNATLISDNGNWWNDGTSQCSDIVVDKNNIVHMVWYDNSNGPWNSGIENEIFYVNYSSTTGFLNATPISGIGINDWNDGNSYRPKIDADNTDTDDPSKWGTDQEIFYMKYNKSTGWSNATAISGIGVNEWNNDISNSPAIGISGEGIISVVFYDTTDGAWGTDSEIMYLKYTPNPGWVKCYCNFGFKIFK
ncbi:MAG: hypothetical protein ACTSPQ_08700 [Candidatus Helarchaeota archaeon]